MKPTKLKPGQESVWDYPRPPRLESLANRLRVQIASLTLADSTRGYRVLETSHPPVYYLPPADIRMEYFEINSRRSWCEWKGEARYLDCHVGERRVADVAWFYPAPTTRFAKLAGYVAFYASKVDACFVDDERVQPQAGDFYGGWITSNIVGPFKGGPGTMGW